MKYVFSSKKIREKIWVFKITLPIIIINACFIYYISIYLLNIYFLYFCYSFKASLFPKNLLNVNFVYKILFYHVNFLNLKYELFVKSFWVYLIIY